MSMEQPLQHQSSRLGQIGNDNTTFENGSLRIREVVNMTLVRMRATSGTEPGLIGSTHLPVETGECLGNDPTAMCLRPGEWLLLDEGADADRLLARLEDPTTEGKVFAWDQTDGLAVLRVEGPAAAWLMRKNSGLDFHITTGTSEHCTQCKFGRIGLVIHFHRDAEGAGVFDLVADRSLVGYLWKLLLETAPHASELFTRNRA